MDHTPLDDEILNIRAFRHLAAATAFISPEWVTRGS